MQTNNPITSNLTNMIKKIITHKHTKTLSALLVIAGLIGYGTDYRKSEAFEYSTYMYNVNIQSSNAANKSVGAAGDEVKLSFEVYDAEVLSNLTASIDGRPIAVTCELINTQVLTFNFIEKAYAQFYNPAMCSGSIVLTQVDIDVMPFIFNTLPFQIKFTQLTPDPVNGDGFVASDFVATNTDDGSSVTVKRNPKASDYISNVHIESTTPSDITLASTDNQVIVSYYINEYLGVSNHKGLILDKEAKISCVSAKEGIPKDIEFTANAAVEVVAESAIKFPRVKIIDPLVPITPPQAVDQLPVPATEAPAQVRNQLDALQQNLQKFIQDTPAAFLDSVFEKSYAQVKETGGGNFTGPAKCTAIIDVTQEDIDNAEYSVVPFSIGMLITTRVDKSEIKIENTTDKSFVRIVKNAVVSLPAEVSQSAGILAIGLTSPTPTAIIPQGVLIKDENNQNIKNSNNTNNLDINGKCIPIKGFYKLGDKNIEIKEIKKSINKRMGTNLPITDKFDKELFNTLKDWQEKYRDTVLDPWEMERPSGYFYKTSNWSMNYQNGCSVPKFVLEKYKNR